MTLRRLALLLVVAVALAAAAAWYVFDHWLATPLQAGD